MTENRVNYTAASVTESATAGADFTPAWTTPVKGIFVNNNTNYDAKIVKTDTTTSTGTVVVSTSYANFDATTGKIAASNFPAAAEGHTVAYKVAYQYDNVVIPQSDIPQLTAQMQGIELAAKARRIAVYYSQMAAFQAKTEMGVDLGEVLATQACAELSYEIDTEVVNTLTKAAFDQAPSATGADVTFNRTLPYGVSKRDHYAGFAETIEKASQIIYDRTQKHAANYMITSSSLKPMFVLMEGWKAASTSKINGPYFAGTLNGVKVYVSPAIPADKFILGYNGGDMITSAAVFAPYMAIVPTQLLGFSDGAMSQGFSSLYDLKMLNPALLVCGKVVEEAYVVLTDEQA